jgi:hypothetical protein
MKSFYTEIRGNVNQVEIHSNGNLTTLTTLDPDECQDYQQAKFDNERLREVIAVLQRIVDGTAFAE